MKEAFEKIIERLEIYRCRKKSSYGCGSDKDFVEAIEIVNQVAEEYGEGTNVGHKDTGKALQILDMFLHKQCDLERTKFAYDANEVWEAVKIARDTLQCSNNINDHSNDGWIPCSEDTPKLAGWYLAHVQHVRNDFITIEKVLWKKCKYGRWKWYRKGNDCEVIAWMPLPQPFKPKGE